MPKFIRTKNGIYEYNNSYIIENDVLYAIVFDDPYTDYGVNGKYSRGKVINQADTIDELCDGYYLDFGGSFNVNFVYGKNELSYLKRQYLQNIKCGEIVKIKGFIKTDKGLIFVAETDNKGDLKLIC